MIKFLLLSLIVMAWALINRSLDGNTRIEERWMSCAVRSCCQRDSVSALQSDIGAPSHDEGIVTDMCMGLES